MQSFVFIVNEEPILYVVRYEFVLRQIMAFFMCSMLTDLLTYFCYIEKFSIQ